MKNMKFGRTILIIVILVAMLSAVTGGTIAWFTDSVESTVNVIQAGNLDIELEYSKDMEAWAPVKETTALFDNDALWEPGHTQVVYLRVKNAGSLALTYKLGLTVASEINGVNKAGESFKLSDYIEYGIVKDVETKYSGRTTARAAVTTAAKLNGIANFGAEEYTVEAGDPADVFALVAYMPETVGNEANHNGVDAPVINLGVSAIAKQAAVEQDSFDANYDAAASYAAEIDAFQATLNAAQAGDTVTLALTQNAYLAPGTKLVAPNGVDVILEGNGHTIYADKAIHVVAGQRDCDITIKNVTIVGTMQDDAIISQNNGVGSVNILMENVTVNLSSISGVPNWPVCLGGSGNATLKNCVITGAGLPSGDYADGNQFFAGAQMNVTVINSQIDSIMLNNGSNGDSATLNVDTASKIGTVYLEAKDASKVTGSVENVKEMVIPVQTNNDLKKYAAQAKRNETVTIALSKDITCSEEIEVADGAKLVIHGCGKTITTSSGVSTLFKTNGAVEMDNLTIAGDAQYALYSVSGNDVLTNVNVKMDRDYAVCFYGGGNVELNNCVINGNAKFTNIWFGDGRTVTINGGTYSSMCINASTGAGVGSAGKLTVNNAKVDIIYGGAYEANGEVVRATIVNNNSTIDKIEYEK